MTEVAPGRRGRSGPRGATLDPQALRAVQAVLGGAPRRADLLIEYLHLLQDHYGCLRHRHLRALAEEMRLPDVVPSEVASFYAHFDVVEDAAPAPPLTLRVCEGLPCAMAGGHQLLTALQQAAPAGARVVAAPCMGACHRAPACAVGQDLVEHATPATVAQVVAKGAPPAVAPPGLAEYRARGGYRVLAAALSGALSPEAMLAAVEAAGLRGLGGAGFPTARRWRVGAAQPGPRELVVNADEGEPGTFKDRHCLE